MSAVARLYPCRLISRCALALGEFAQNREIKAQLSYCIVVCTAWLRYEHGFYIDWNMRFVADDAFGKAMTSTQATGIAMPLHERWRCVSVPWAWAGLNGSYSRTTKPVTLYFAGMSYEIATITALKGIA